MNNSSIDSTTDALGFADVSVKFNDGREEVVRVNATPIRSLPNFAARLDNPVELVEYVCHKPAPWGDTLTDESVYEIDAIARKLTNPRLARFLERHAAVQERAMEMLPPSLRASALEIASQKRQ